MYRRCLLTALFAGFLLGTPASAETVPDAATERGFVAGKAFALAQYDAVNLFNGGLSLDIPIGPSYQVGPSFSYQLRLTYSSKTWEYGTPSCAGPTGYPSWIGLKPNNDGCVAAGTASPEWNAGLGWRLGYGFLVDGPITPTPPWYENLMAGYHSPDGAVHTFFDSLHDPDWGTSEPFNDEYCRQSDAVCFTRDSSYLRLRRPSPNVRVIDAPDGMRTTFGYNDGFNRWLPTRIEDAFGNGMTITYPDSMTWVVTDDRRSGETNPETLRVLFEADPLHPNGKRVRQVKVLTFRDQGGTRRSQIDFVYATPAAADAPYPECAAVGANTGQTPYLGGMLQRVVHPVETSGAPDDWNFDFNYYFHNDDVVSGSGDLHCDQYAGQLRSMQLPTGATVEWGYGTYLTPAMDCLDPPEPPVGGGPREPPVISGQKFGGTSGVLERREIAANGTELSYRLYAPGSVYWPVDNHCGTQFRSPIKHVARVQYQQIGNTDVSRTESYFSTYAIDLPDSADHFRAEEYGLPLTHAPCDPGNAASLCLGLSQRLPNPRVANGKEYYLSSTIHRCEREDMTSGWVSNTQTRIFGRELHPSCQLFQARYVRYERSFKTCTTEEGSCSNINSRVAGEMTVYYNDPEEGPATEVSYETTDSSHFGGFGVYREVQTNGNVPAPGSGDDANIRTTTQDLLPAAEFNLSADGQSVSASGAVLHPEAVSPWLFSRSNSIVVSEPGKGMAKTLLCYEPNGFLVGKRTLEASDGQTDDHDLVVKYGKGADATGGGGFVTSTHYLGGDNTSVSGVDLCTPPTANEGEYIIASASTYGVPSFSAFKRGNANFFVTLDLDVHRSGLVTASRDHAGVVTHFAYDDRGRINDIEPQNAARTEIRYLTDHAGGPQATVALKFGTGPGSVIRSETYLYDNLGRLLEEHRQVPGPAGTDLETVRCRDYVQAGFVKHETEFLPRSGCAGLTSENYTEYDDYDPFGRPKHITTPDGALSKFNYNGGHVKTEVRWIRTPSGTSEVKTEFLTNRQGNLIQVVEDTTAADPATARLKTRYRYDLGNRLTRVEQIDDTAGGTGTTQVRTFNYDQRGFLLSEVQPELGPSGGGTILYGGYDAMGHVGSKRHAAASSPAPPWSFDLDFRYDKAGRLVQVLNGGKFAKEYFYARGAEAGAWGAGKLYQTKRRNEVQAKGGAIDLAGVNDRVVVTETFRYDDPAGRMSAREVRTNDGGLFSSSLTYDALGNLLQLGYPHCSYPAGCAGAAPPRTVAHQYRLGMLTAVDGYASSIRYHSNGLWSSVVHSNGVEDRLSLLQEPGAVSLPGHITAVVGATALLDLGPYTFDSARNVTGIGQDQFFYDRIGRLVRADLALGATTKTQHYTYDRFSNLTAVTLVGGAAGDQHATPVNPATNRLVNGVEYDQAGNQTSATWGAFRAFDAFNQMVVEYGTGINRSMLYTASDERLAVRDQMANQTTWSLRGVGNEVLRQVAGPISSGSWSWKKDYVYRGGSLLAAVIPAGSGTTTEHFHLDHLGSTRLVTNALGAATGPVMKYWPYGDVAEGPTEGEVMRYTGHERDFNCPAGGGLCTGIGRQDDLDYMHARYYSPWNGRFLSVDPVGGRTERPMGWNRYAYGLGNPMKYLDPDGRDNKIYIFQTLPWRNQFDFSELKESIESSTNYEVEITNRATKAEISTGLQAADTTDLVVIFGHANSDGLETYQLFGEGSLSNDELAANLDDRSPPAGCIIGGCQSAEAAAAAAGAGAGFGLGLTEDTSRVLSFQATSAAVLEFARTGDASKALTAGNRALTSPLNKTTSEFTLFRKATPW